MSYQDKFYSHKICYIPLNGLFSFYTSADIALNSST